MPAAVTAGLVHHDIALRYETDGERIKAHRGQLAEEQPKKKAANKRPRLFCFSLTGSRLRQRLSSRPRKSSKTNAVRQKARGPILWPPREANEQANRPGGGSSKSGSTANAWLAGAETHLALAKCNAARTVDRVQAARQDLQAMCAPIDTLDQLRGTLWETVVGLLNGTMLPLQSFNLPLTFPTMTSN
jgi:hypothetical protein